MSDLNRMLHAIEHECAIRVKELRLEATEEYNKVKSELIAEREKDLEKEFQRRAADVRSREHREESRERQTHRIKIEGLKAALFDEIIQGVREGVLQHRFDSNLLESILKIVKIDDMIVYVDKRDQEMTEEILSKSDVRYKVNKMPIEGMGGVIVCSRDCKEIWDNSFETRINIFIDSHADMINKIIFKE